MVALGSVISSQAQLVDPHRLLLPGSPAGVHAETNSNWRRLVKVISLLVEAHLDDRFSYSYCSAGGTQAFVGPGILQSKQRFHQHSEISSIGSIVHS